MKTSIILIIFMTISFVSVHGQITFQKTYGTTNNDYGYTITSTFDGGYILAGSYNNGMIGVIKVNEYGDTIWVKTLPFSNSKAYSIIQTTDSNFVLAGTTNSSAFVFKINSIGDTIWTRNINYGIYPLVARKIVEDDFGNLIFVGSQEILQGNNCCSPLIVKLYENGNIIWNSFIECPSPFGCRLKEIFIDKEGNYIVSGDTPYPNVPTARLTKLDTSGNVLWNKYYSQINASIGSIIQSQDSDYVSIGINWANDSMPVIKTDKNGNLISFNEYKGIGTHWYGASIDTTNGGYLISGNNGNTNNDIFLIKLDFNNQLLWTNIYGDTLNDNCSKMESTSDGGCIILGSTNSFGTGNSDFYLIKTNQNGLVDGQTENNLTNNIIFIYPNPFSTSTTIKFVKNLNNATLIIRNVMGQEIEKINNIYGNEIQLQRKGLNNGIYFITLTKDNSIILFDKLIIIN